ncbi:MAG: M56 family metallopeptidase [Haliscomenobacter sp.]|uniref:M56 family metallopeptidase n=1 Tax=Haliscomenobacter sp. TaxID=2717303 RepID=UPI0029AB81FF|nr:M56 family metallopeptidase [Haliscomenobacter sp.]MDX2067454.1 M56 family metallopeptidase [Haliscomenobacter sp.]
MDWLFATFIVSERVLHALSWTLLHSLWQGAIVASCAGILFFGTAYLSARIRYNLLFGLMVLFVGMVSLTFGAQWGEHEKKSNEKPELLAEFQYKGTTVTSIFAEPATIHLDKKQPWIQLFERYKGLLLFAWGLVLLFKSIKMSLDLAYIYRIRLVKTRPIAAVWNSRLQALSKQLGINQKVRLLESGIIQGPASLGIYKPLILLPIGLVNHLTVAQVEAILLHELAHIRRRDYLVNVLQCVLENVFFFNPALLWLSHRIREERENCCDDLALQVLQDKQLYAQTLLRFQEYQWREPQYAQAFGGDKTPLLTRIKRILNRRDYRALQVYEKVALIFGLLCIGVFLMWAKPTPPIETFVNDLLEAQSSSPSLTEELTDRPVILAPTKQESLYSGQANSNSIAQQLKAGTVAYSNAIQAELPLEDSIPTTAAREFAQLQAELTFATKQYEREKNRYDSIKALVEKTIDKVAAQVTPSSKNSMFQDHVISSLVVDLMADGIIKDAKALRSFRLDAGIFKVNGRKQPRAIIEKYQKNYIRNPLKGNYLRITKSNQQTYVQRIDNSQPNQ